MISITQSITSYLVNQILPVLIVEPDYSTLTTGNRVVFVKTVKIYKNVDNVIELRYVNRNQKPASILNRDIKFYIVDQAVQQVVVTKNGTTLDDGSTTANIGKGRVIILASDIVLLPAGFYNFSTKLVNSSDPTDEYIGYVDDNYGVTGVMQIISGVYPDIDTMATDTTDEYDLGSILTRPE